LIRSLQPTTWRKRKQTRSLSSKAFADQLELKGKLVQQPTAPVRRQTRMKRGTSRFSSINRPSDEDEPTDLLLAYKCAYPICFSRPSQVVDELTRAEEENLERLDQMEARGQQLTDAQATLDEMKVKAKAKVDKLEAEQRVLMGRVTSLEKSIEKTRKELAEGLEAHNQPLFEGVASLLHRILQLGKERPERETRLPQSDWALKESVLCQLKAVETLIYRVGCELGEVDNRDRLSKVN